VSSSSAFEDETVVINLDSGNYYTLDAMAAALWERLNESVALGGLIAETQRDYTGDPAEIEQAVREYVGLLLSEQLVRPVVVPPRRSAAAGPSRSQRGAGRGEGRKATFALRSSASTTTWQKCFSSTRCTTWTAPAGRRRPRPGAMLPPSWRTT
jgi:hypothetical protein